MPAYLTTIGEEYSVTKVITYGTYDLFHEGHYRLLQRAKQLGDYLIVGVTTEEYDRTRDRAVRLSVGLLQSYISGTDKEYFQYHAAHQE